jgi:3-oxoacyl-[acyl-carrier protein] reductase
MKRVFLTGASRGIGAAIRNALRVAGYSIVSPSRSELDLSDRKSVESYLNHIQPQADILINNAGENIVSSIEEIDLTVWDRLLQINLTSALQFTRYFAPQMKARGFGRIINISSAYSQKAREGRAMYSCAKAALDALTRTTAVEYSKWGVCVNSVCPGFVETELTKRNNGPEQIKILTGRIPMGRLASPEEIAELVLFLASEANTYLSGQSIQIDGAFSIS